MNICSYTAVFHGFPIYMSCIVQQLEEHACDPAGHWPPNTARDAAHPNSLGHQGLFSCIDLPAMLGSQ